MLAGLAALSFLSPAAIAGIMAFLFGAVPCALSSAATLAAIATGAFIFLAPVFVCGIVGFFNLTIKIYEGVFSSAPIFGYVFAAMSAICLVMAIKWGIDALVLKRTKPEDLIKQTIQPEFEKHINLFQKNINSQMEKNNDDASVNIENRRLLGI